MFEVELRLNLKFGFNYARFNINLGLFLWFYGFYREISRIILSLLFSLVYFMYARNSLFFLASTSERGPKGDRMEGESTRDAYKNITE